MSYIDPALRRSYDTHINLVQNALKIHGNQHGHLNYVITRLIMGVWRASPAYCTLAGITGVLANVAAEFYRRVAGPFEFDARLRNGDVQEYAEEELGRPRGLHTPRGQDR